MDLSLVKVTLLRQLVLNPTSHVWCKASLGADTRGRNAGMRPPPNIKSVYMTLKFIEIYN